MVSEEVLVKKCKEGNALAQKAVYDRFSPKMLGVCLRYSSNKHEAEDILQDGFIKVFQKIDSYTGNGSFEGWVRRTIVNTCLDHIRKTKNLKLNVDIDTVGYLEPIAENVHSDLATQDLLQMVQSMPLGYKTVFNMFAIEGYSHKEIGQELKISENTSKTQYRKAKLYLQEKILELESSYLNSGKAG